MISIVTVNFNNAGATAKLLSSLERQTDSRFDVLLVDNASEEADRTELGEFTTTSPLSLDVIYNSSNRGFSGGNNIAIRKALEQGSEWVVLLNNDTSVSDDFIEKLRSNLNHQPAVIGIPLHDGNATAYAGSVRWLRPTLPHLTSFEQTADGSKLHYAIGAGVAVHREVFEKIGLLDERYFLYFEDADFSMRALRKKIPVRFLEIPVIEHGVSQSTSRLGSPLLLRYHMRNALLFNATNGPFFARITLHLWPFFAMFKQLFKLLVVPSKRAQSTAIARGIIDYYAKRFGHISPEKTNNRH